MRKFFTLLMFFVTILSQAITHDTVQVMTYNLLNFTTNSTNRINYFKSVLAAVNPDILVVQEITSQSAVNMLFTLVLDNSYAPGLFVDGYDSDNAIFYKHADFSFLSNTPINTDLRDINQFTLVHKTSGDTLHIFSLHLKSSTGTANELKRAQEVTKLRNITNTFSPGTNFIVCGDFNIYKSTEPAYINLISDNGTNEGYLIDPQYMPGTWNNYVYAGYHTQSTRLRQFGGGASGGLNDRFDMILFSKGISDSGGIQFVNGSTWPFGNDGNHYNDSINAVPNTSVAQEIANALHNASDHLPVVALFTFEVPEPSYEFPIQLVKGWNGISSPLYPVDTGIEQMLDQLGENLILIQNFSGIYFPDEGIISIANWDIHSGYMIKMEHDAEFIIQGYDTGNNQIPILQGWNLIPVLSENHEMIENLFGGNIDKVQIIKEVAGSGVYWPDAGVNTIGFLIPGHAYYVKCNTPFSLNYP